MREYIICICFSILFCVGVNLLVPSPRYAGIIKIVCGIFILHTMLMPLKGIINTELSMAETDKFFDTEENFSTSVNQSKEAMKSALKNNSVTAMENQLQRELEDVCNGRIELKYDKDTLKALIETEDIYKEDIRTYLAEFYGIEAVFE